MKKNIFQIMIAVMALTLGFVACQPDEFELGTSISKDALKYSITQDTEDPNMVLLESMTAGAQPHWITPLGRSTRVKDTVKLAFPGIYDFAYGVMSEGGYVQDDTLQVEITTTNFDYINDPLWELLSGGVGNSKTWYLDLDADGVSRYFAGPLYFYGTDNGWLGDCYGEDCWNWNPDYPGNSWLMDAGNYGSMTFDLQGNANVHVEHLMLGREEVGTYFLDADAKTLTMNDATPLHDSGRDGHVVNWGDLKIFTLTEDYMQLAALRDEALSGEGPCLLVYNFVSKDYFDNWVPEETEDPEPILPDGWKDDVSATTSTSIKWVLSPETPFNWANLDGSLMNTDWVSADTYADWTGMNADVPATYADFSLTMNSADNTVAMVLPDGTESSGTYELDEKGIYTFTGVKPEFVICGGWVTLSTTAENQWRILSIEKDALGGVSAMWVGALAADKPEYMCYKLVPQVGGGTNALEAIKELLTAKTWKLDSDRTHDVATGYGAEQGPVMFSDFATWAWNPLPGEHYASGEADVDYGDMKFEMDGTVTVNQRKRVYTYVDADSGETLERHGSPEETDVLASEEVVTLNGSWSIDLDNNKLLMTVGAVHPWTCDYYVLNWGDIDINKMEDGVLLLQVMRDAERSGEDAFAMTYVYVPAE
ncbi:hypothetical protein J1N10_17150 [Carboxylicivirga sp. A043]|uniref:hypothetical protein n=1 Tax=Carboxylicivirga litoralis TaxID=2816963 RepID=UPI0021CB6C20|nr:hypothetical protein [Carboxylicivirga sp. A043]MCU4157705.1 hypothetical protein [Carboxylicivirga sp. A043]